MIDFARVIDKLEQCFARQDLAGAEQLLLFWRREALSSDDERALQQLDNELLGLYRRTNDRDKGLAVAARLLPRLAQDNVGDAIVKLNIATNYCHFGMPQQAAPIYAEAQRVLEAQLPEDDYRLASLYNNMASMHNATKHYAEAEALYAKALQVIRRIVPTPPELAVTLVNYAVSKYMQNPLDGEVDAAMCEAYRVLQQDDIPHDGNYAFVLSKVIPVYAHLGYSEEQAHLERLRKQVTDAYGN